MKTNKKMIQNFLKKEDILRRLLILSLFLSFYVIVFLNHPNIERYDKSQISDLNEVRLSQTKELEINSTNLANFFNAFVPNFLDEWKITGMTLSVVNSDSILFSKGYGYADIENDILVDSNKTIFQIGSISKIITMTAVMQLVEQSLLELDEDVNKYLIDFKIPNTFSEPITLYHLLTHTAGFDDASFLNTKYNNGSIRPFKDIIKITLPARIRKPGILSSYSNYGFMLTGYIVEVVSNQSFFNYINENIFSPLNMNFSSSINPVPQELHEYMSNGYTYNNDEKRFSKYVSPADPVRAAGGMSTTASDMAKFMMAYLNNGTYNNLQILEKSTVQMILSRQFGYHFELPGMCLGFWEEFLNDIHTISHTGDKLAFHNKLALIPKFKIGIFFSFNSYNPEKMGDPQTPYLLNRAFYRSFLDFFFPKQQNNHTYETINQHVLQKYIGTYRLITAAPEKSIMKSVSFLYYKATIFKISANSNGTLNYDGKTLYQIAPNLFQSVDGDIMVYFIEDNNGKIRFAGVNIGAAYTLERIALYESLEFNMFILVFSLFVFILTLIVGLILIIKRKIKKEQKYEGHLRISRIIAGLNCLLNLSITGAFFVWIMYANYTQISYIYTLLLLSLPTSSLIFACTILIYSIFAWTGRGSKIGKPYWKISGRIYYTILMITNFIYIYFLAYWNVFGF